ncbi:hypothetical protein CNQ36_01740 [Streptomyces fungicidicus]|uniref:Uncharacterized protein n=1 Tax=Streptomyces fungicidicus TaxID=68203 RepID=A0A494UID6_9ACTN|nr:hypothetical protein CNQ36_01740 [Streptomyces fungicidicus]
MIMLPCPVQSHRIRAAANQALSRHTLSIEDPEIIPGPAGSAAAAERSVAQHRRCLAHRFANRTRPGMPTSTHY